MQGIFVPKLCLMLMFDSFYSHIDFLLVHPVPFRIGLMLMLQPPEWCSENVCKFPVDETLGRFLGSIYHIETIQIDSVSYGLPVGRLRSYTVGHHKMKCVRIERPLSLEAFAMHLQRPCNFGWEELWWVQQLGSILWDDEIGTEINWASSRTSVVAAGVPDADGMQTTAVPNLHLPEGTDLKWFEALTPVERFNAETYELKWPGRAYSLTQSAVDHATKSTTKYLQTFIHNFGLLWTWKSNPPRWLSASEALVGMGFPAHPTFLSEFYDRNAGFVLTSFQIPRKDFLMNLTVRMS